MNNVIPIKGSSMPELTMSAQSIVVVNMGIRNPVKQPKPGYTVLDCKIILFNPTPETLETIRALKSGDKFQGLTLIDRWDDGSFDKHTNPRPFEYVDCLRGGLKEHTFVLNFIEF